MNIITRYDEVCKYNNSICKILVIQTRKNVTNTLLSQYYNMNVQQYFGIKEYEQIITFRQIGLT